MLLVICYESIPRVLVSTNHCRSCVCTPTLQKRAEMWEVLQNRMPIVLYLPINFEACQTKFE
jgi:hypothetical protein